jgi:NAD(P) transhydrogenase subunit alpha
MTDNKNTLTESTADLAARLEQLSQEAANIAINASQSIGQNAGGGHDFLIMGLTVFVLACFVGYHVVWRVTPALHSPLMGITNAISSVIIVGALMAAGPAVFDITTQTSIPQQGAGFSKFLGFLAIILASINIFGGFIITRRMLHMFKKKG